MKFKIHIEEALNLQYVLCIEWLEYMNLSKHGHLGQNKIPGEQTANQGGQNFFLWIKNIVRGFFLFFKFKENIENFAGA